MNVGELKQRLDSFPNETEVFLSSDEEGNGYETVAFVEGEFIYREGREINVVHPDDVEEYGSDNLFIGLVLWP